MTSAPDIIDYPDQNKPAAITVFAKAGGPLSKHIKLENGSPVSDGSPCTMSEGKASIIEVPTAAALAEIINSAASHVAISLGVLKGVANGHAVPIVARAAWGEGSNALTRTLDHMHFRAGWPAWVLLDFDRKGMPAEVATRLDAAGGFDAAVASVLLAQHNVARVIRPSTSSGVRNEATGEVYAGSGGLHVYLHARDGADIARFLKAAFERMWLAGFGWITVSACGALLERSIIDASVGSPERLVFEGAPTLGAGLKQDAAMRTAVANEGISLDTLEACPDLSIAEQAQLRFLIDTAKAGKAAEAEAVREAWIEAHAKEIAQRTQKPLEIVKAELRHSFAGYLFPDFTLHFDDLGAKTVRDVLVEPESYQGTTLADPHEPKRRNHAIVLRGTDGRLRIRSLAHGGLTYQLAHDRASLEALQATTPEALARAFFAALPYAASLDDLDEAAVSERARVKAEWTKAEWGKLLTKARKRRPQIASPKLETEPPARPWLIQPRDDAELNATLRPLDDLLCKVEAPEPPFRTLEGRYAVVAERTLSFTHRLASSEPQPKEDWLPPPPFTAIVEANNPAILSSIEPYVEYRAYHGKGVHDYNRVRLIGAFANAYSDWGLSRLPRVEAVLTLPLVWNSALLGQSGLDRKLGVIFRIDPRLEEILPQAPVKLEVAKASYKWLRETWLKDVAFKSDADAARAIAIPLTVIERFLLDQRPHSLVTGDMPGGGKTTLINMLVASVTGHPAAATAWSDDPEERKKAIFAFCLAGIPSIAFDNIGRGTAIDCPHLASLATSAEKNDRVLGESRYADASTKTVVIFNGIRISTRGEVSSRTLCIEIESQSINPAERQFEHEDPIAWTIDNRVTILKHYFNILMVEHERPKTAKTRFKTWWRLVGNPLELASGIEFLKELYESEDDEEATAKTRIIERLIQIFGVHSPQQSGKFRASDAVPLLPQDVMSEAEVEMALEFAADLKAVHKGRDFAPNARGVGGVLSDYVTGWVRLSNDKVARLIVEKDKAAAVNIYRVEVKHAD
jgi:hypothetical protein